MYLHVVPLHSKIIEQMSNTMDMSDVFVKLGIQGENLGTSTLFKSVFENDEEYKIDTTIVRISVWKFTNYCFWG